MFFSQVAKAEEPEPPASIYIESADEWQTLRESTRNGGRVLVVDFYADWCPPCKVISPFYEE